MPYIIKTAAPKAPSGPIGRLIEFRPPRPWLTTGDPPQIRDMATYEHVHRFRDDRLKDYLERSRGKQHLHPFVREDLLTANKNVLFVCSAEARIDFMRVVVETFPDFGISWFTPHHFVSFAPADCVLQISEASIFDVRSIQQTLREALRGIPFVGMIEAALYKDWGPHGPSPRHDHISWHAHIITWSAERRALEQALKPLRQRSANMYDRPAVYIRTLPVSQIERVLLYILKGQTKSYRVNQTPGQISDPDSGEIWHHTRQQKSWMGTGDHIRMCMVLKDRWLTDFLFGNAEGTFVARFIRYQARKPFCEWAEREHNFAAFERAPYPQIRDNRQLGQSLRLDAYKIRAAFPHAKDLCFD